MGSLLGQIIHVTADERKTLLAAGAAAGMAATFGSPVSAVLLAVELLLFEYRPRSRDSGGAGVGGGGGNARIVRRPGRCSRFRRCSSRRCRRSSSTSCSARIDRRRSPCSRRARSTGSRTCTRSCRFTGCGGRRWAPSSSALIGLVDQRTLGVGYVNIEQHHRRADRRARAADADRAQVHLVVDLPRAAARRAERWRRCSRSAAGSAR